MGVHPPPFLWISINRNQCNETDNKTEKRKREKSETVT